MRPSKKDTSSPSTQLSRNTSCGHPASIDEQTLLSQCDVQRYRGSGPGGQHRNKVETAVKLCHRPSGIVGAAQERRSQEQNLRQAIFRLRVNLALSIRSIPKARFEPSQLWQSRCRQGRMLINPSHDDFPSVLAEALNVLAGCEMDTKKAASLLSITPSQFHKLLKADPRAWVEMNQIRKRLGHHLLK